MSVWLTTGVVVYLRTTRPPTPVVTVSETGDTPSAAISAWLTASPAWVGITTTCALPESPGFSVPTVHVTRPAAWMPPFVAVTKTVPDGSVSVTTTSVAVAVPWLA